MTKRSSVANGTRTWRHTIRMFLAAGCFMNCGPAEDEESSELTQPLAGSTTVLLKDWVMQDLPNNLFATDMGFPATAHTFCFRRMPAPAPVGAHGNRTVFEWLHYAPSDAGQFSTERVIESDLLTQLGPNPTGPFALLGTVQAYNEGGFAGANYSRACWGAEPRGGSDRRCDLDYPYGTIPMNVGMNHQPGTTVAYNSAQFGFVIGEAHRSDKTRRWPLPPPLAAFPAGTEVFNDATIGHAPWRLDVVRKLRPSSVACVSQDDFETVEVSRHRYVYVQQAPFGNYYGNVLQTRGGADRAITGNHDALVHIAEFQSWACRGVTTKQACEGIPVCGWSSAGCQVNNARAEAFEKALNQTTNLKFSASIQAGSPQSLRAPHLEIKTYVRGWGMISGAWGTDPDCDLAKCTSSNTEAKFECLARCNGTFGFHASGAQNATGYPVPPDYTTGAQGFVTPWASSFSQNLRRTGYNPSTWRVNAALSIRPFSRDAPNICKSKPANCDAAKYECRNRVPQPSNAAWCSF